MKQQINSKNSTGIRGSYSNNLKVVIKKANVSHKKDVLRLLDEFRTTCSAIINPGKNFISSSAKDNGGDLFDKIVKSPDSAIFLAIVENKYVGIVTVHKIPQIRKGFYVAEIEEMYVEKEFQGKSIAQQLINSVFTWTQKQGIKVLRLESSNELSRAHNFYEKSGFRFYGRAYEKRVI